MSLFGTFPLNQRHGDPEPVLKDIVLALAAHAPFHLLIVLVVRTLIRCHRWPYRIPDWVCHE